jgi:hypothetical protein
LSSLQGGHGAVRNVSFEDIQLEDVGTPIQINQLYCPQSQHPGKCEPGSSAVQISDITVRRMVRASQPWTPHTDVTDCVALDCEMVGVQVNSRTHVLIKLARGSCKRLGKSCHHPKGVQEL